MVPLVFAVSHCDSHTYVRRHSDSTNTPLSMGFCGLTELTRAFRRNLNRTSDGRPYPAIFQREKTRDCAAPRCCDLLVNHRHHQIKRGTLTGDCIFDLGWVRPRLKSHPRRALDGWGREFNTSNDWRINGYRLCAASSNASARGRPIITPPSAIASRNMAANAGPDPPNAVHASKCFSSRNLQRPIDEKMLRIMDRSRGWFSSSVDTIVIPSRICNAPD